MDAEDLLAVFSLDEVAKTLFVTDRLGERLKRDTEIREATASEINIFFIILIIIIFEI